MSKINQIEKAILQLEGGRFQSLVDQYLYRRYKYTNIQSLGSQQGTDKTTKGIPDSYVRTDNGKYIVIMYGTYSNEPAKYSKVKSDIESCLKCLNKDDLYEIICCHTSSNFTIEQDKEINSLFNNITLIGINTLSNDLYYRYPALAKEFLSVAIDTNQILAPDDFINDNNNSIFGTPLDVELIGREKEFDELSQILLKNDIVVVEGPSGIGKTKLTYECCKKFSDDYNYEFRIIKNRNLSIYDDINTYFSDNDNYLIMVDDANKLTDLEFVLELIKNNCADKNFKIILTVRDYAKNDTISKIKEYHIPIEYQLKALESKIIVEIIEKNLGIKNQAFLDQISNISKGNVRLAFMAGINAKKEGFFANIQNVAEIFSNYFKYILKNFDDKEKIVMAIIAFVESFEIQNKESLVYRISNTIDIEENYIKEVCKKMHDFEVVDVYEDLAVKFSDQNLSDYIIYHVLFIDRSIKLDELIKITFPIIEEKVIYHLNTTLKLFYSENNLNYLKESITNIWSDVKTNDELAYNYAKSFHNLIEDDVLLFLKQEIHKTNVNQVDMLHYKYKSNNSFCKDKILSILIGYKYSDNVDSAIELFIQYILRNNSNPDEIKTVLIEGFGIEKNSYKNDYKFELSIMEILYKSYKEKPNDTLAVLCMLYASCCLKYSFDTTELGYKSNSFNIIYFSIANSDGIKKLHKKSIEILCSFYNKTYYKLFAYNELLNYRPQGIHYQFGTEDLIPIMESDSIQIENALKSFINVSDIVDCKLIHHFDKWYKRNKTKVSPFFSTWESNRNFKLIKKLQKNNYGEDTNTREELDKQTLEDIKTDIYSLSISEIEELLCDASKIKLDNEWQFYNNISKVVCDYNGDKLFNFVDLLIRYTPNNYFVSNIIEKMINNYGYDKSFDFINSYDITKIVNWFCGLINYIPDDKIDLNFCKLILEGIKENNILYRLQFETLNRINNKYPSFLPEYVKEVLNVYKSKKESSQLASDFLFTASSFYKDNIDVLISMFESVKQFKELYIFASKDKEYFDYDDVMFIALVKKDISIIDSIVDLYYEDGMYSENFSHIKTLWELENYLSLMEYTIDYIIDNGKYSCSISYCLDKVFEVSKTNNDKIEKLIYYLIDKHIDDDNYIKQILHSSDVFSKEIRFKITKYICKKSNSAEMFYLCPIGPLPRDGWSGSEVPIIENRIKEFEEMLSWLKGSKFIEHRAYCNERINSLRERIKKVISREFIYDY